MRKRPIKWEESDTFNPAAAVKDGKIVAWNAKKNTEAYPSLTYVFGASLMPGASLTIDAALAGAGTQIFIPAGVTKEVRHLAAPAWRSWKLHLLVYHVRLTDVCDGRRCGEGSCREEHGENRRDGREVPP